MDQKLYNVVSNVISNSEIADILKYFETNKQKDHGREGYSFCKLTPVGEFIEKIGLFGDTSSVPKELLPLIRAVRLCYEYFISNFNMENNLEYKRGFLNSMEAGAFNRVHSDDDDIYHGKISGEVSYSALLFFTGPESYEGGELGFTDSMTEEVIKLKPLSGDLVLFKGSVKHQVDVVTSGQRVNYVIFFRDVLK